MSRKIALVGHCGPDSYMLRSQVKHAIKDSQVDMITHAAGLERAIAEGVELLLVNRVLDGSFDDQEGVSLIKRIAATHPHVATMLISNYPESQQAAEAAGARPGFGKSEVGSAKMRDALLGALV
ncbi:MAG: response regulator [Tepidisphaeraceae bacterium]